MAGVEYGPTGSDHSDTVVVSGNSNYSTEEKYYAKLILNEKRSVSVSFKSKLPNHRTTKLTTDMNFLPVSRTTKNAGATPVYEVVRMSDVHYPYPSSPPETRCQAFRGKIF